MEVAMKVNFFLYAARLSTLKNRDAKIIAARKRYPSDLIDDNGN